MPISATLKLIDFQLWVHLGCTPEEQVNPQEIRVSIEIKFSSLPLACQSDAVENTVCYAALSERVRKFCIGSRVKTIEKLAMGCFEALKEEVPLNHGIHLRIHKIRPPVDGLLGGSIFELGTEV